MTPKFPSCYMCNHIFHNETSYFLHMRCCYNSHWDGLMDFSRKYKKGGNMNYYEWLRFNEIGNRIE